MSDTDALLDIEPCLMELHATASIVRHLAPSSEVVAEVEWNKLAADLNRCSEKLDALWDRACDERTARVEAHKRELAAARAAREVPGSPADIERAEALWVMLRAMVEVAGRQCGVAGYPLNLERLAPDHEPLGTARRDDAGFVD